MSEDRRHNREAADARTLAELISAYLDDPEYLSAEELANVERLVAEDDEARRIHAELRVISQALTELEPIPAPRDYHLTAEMVGAPEPVQLQARRDGSPAWYARHADTVRWATAAAAVIFVFVLGADLILNGVLSDPATTGDSVQTNQADTMVREADDADDGDAAADDSAMDEEAGGDAGAGEDAPPVVTPEVAEDGASGGQEAEESADDPEAAALAPEAEDGEDQGANNDDAAAATAEALSEEPATDEASGNTDMFAFDADESAADESSSDRRLWRIAEFGLVVVLGLLITAMVVLPRLGRNNARAASD